jgi:hypothetical protein
MYEDFGDSDTPPQNTKFFVVYFFHCLLNNLNNEICGGNNAYKK